MLHNVFNCNLLLVNLQDMFSNVNESKACRRRGGIREQNTPLGIICRVVYRIRKHARIHPYTHLLWELSCTCALSVFSFILLIVNYSFILLNFSNACCYARTIDNSR